MVPGILGWFPSTQACVCGCSLQKEKPVALGTAMAAACSPCRARFGVRLPRDAPSVPPPAPAQASLAGAGTAPPPPSPPLPLVEALQALPPSPPPFDHAAEEGEQEAPLCLAAARG